MSRILRICKAYFCAAVIAALALAAACNEVEPVMEDATGSLILCISPDLAVTRAASSTASETYEKQVNSMEVYIFNDGGNIAQKLSLADFTASSGTYSKSVNLPVGTYTVWAVANKAVNATSLSDLESKAIALGDNSTTASAGFVMAGSNTATLAKSGTSVAVAMTRFVGRVRLVSVTNSASPSGSVVVTGAFLENVVGNQTIKGNAAISTWVNLAGRVGGNGAVVTASTAGSPALTFYSGTSWPRYFYGFANGTSSDQKKNGSVETVTAGKTRVVVCATYYGTPTYYPVTIDNFQRNKSYDISLVITGPGSDDPNTDPEKGGLAATITVTDWESGADAQTVTI